MKAALIDLRSFAAASVISTIASAGPVGAAQIPVDGGYTATPTTLPPTYEDSGGTELTDGDLGTLVWPDAGTDAVPLTGWQNVDATATFNFTGPVNIGRIVAWFADSDGNSGVGLPESVRVTTTGGFDQLFPVTNPDGSGTTVAIVLDGFDITTDNVTLEIARDTALDNPVCCGGVYEWTMMSEVQFFTPGHATPPMLLTPLAVDLGDVLDDAGVVTGGFNISNIATATSDLTISGVSLSGADAANFTLGVSPSSLMPGEVGQVGLSFDSGGVPGTYSANVDISSNDADSPASVPVTIEVFSPLVPSTAYQQAVMASGPMLYWTFDEVGDTDDAMNLASNLPTNRLVAQGGATRVSSTTTAGGVSLGRAASFDGLPGSRFFASDLAPEGTIDQFAIEFWFNPSFATPQYISETSDGSGTFNLPGVIYGYNAHSADEFEIFAGVRSGTPISPATGTWRHVVVAHYGEGTVEIYIDGVAALVTGDYSSVHAFGGMGIGATSLGAGTDPYGGLVDEYAIYDLGGVGDMAAQQAHVAGIAAHFSVSDDPLGFRITDITLLPNNQISITWISRPNTDYSVFWSSDLANFDADVDDFVPSQGSTTTFVFDNPSVDFENPEGLPNVFLRVSEN